MSKVTITAAVVVMALSCSAMAATGVGGYRWGTWERLDQLDEGTVTNVMSMAMGVRNGKLGVAYVVDNGIGFWAFNTRYSEYAYSPGVRHGLLNQTVTNEDLPPDAGKGVYGAYVHGVQFD